MSKKTTKLEDWKDWRIINTAKRLFAGNYIDAETLSRLKYDSTGIIDDTDFPVDVCDNGDVNIRECGAYPLTLKGFTPSILL